MSMEIVAIAKKHHVPLSALLTSLAINNLKPSDSLSIVSLACKIHNIPCLFSVPPNHTEKEILESLNYELNIPDTAQIMTRICYTIDLNENEILYYLEKILLLHLDGRINSFNYFGKGYGVYDICLAILKEEDLVFYEMVSVECRNSNIDTIRMELKIKHDSET